MAGPPYHRRMNTSPVPRFTPALARIVATVSVGFIVTQLDVTIVNIALAKIGADLHANVTGLQWIVDAYTLAFAVLMLSAGVLGDRFGARRMFACGIALFAAASLACGLASGAALLVAARAVQGMGAAAMLPNSLALLNEACSHDPKLRARAVGLWTAAGAIAIAAGPVIGGLLIAAFGWRAIFLVNLPICALGLAATFAWVPHPRAASTDKAPDKSTRASTVRGIDPVGQLLAVVALTAFTGAVIEWRPLGLANPLVYGSFMLALIATVAFIITERRVDTPMLPLTFFGNRTFSAAVLFGICVNLTYYGVVFVLSLYLQHARGETPLQAGLAFLPLTGGFLVSNVASGWVVGRFGARVPMIAGAITAALGYGLLHFAQAASPLWTLLVPFLLIPSGMGLAVPAMTTAVLASVDTQRAGTASAVLNTARQAGGAVGVAAFGALASASDAAGAAHVVAGLRSSTLISSCILLCALGLACLVHPEPHARDRARAGRNGVRAANASK
ncbi:MFS transporter, DHA2 family, methylenomycin A resistance protein [Paraburkholderia steynii]|uniref:MFS transporter, DHA2 family, methylenomycin A resistance protein n=1 Tax=Paraburkholderia steynii TaxID=1245441 RepID=A0A7Z7B6I5_9BURK|nr:MFS transporter [Paraburkholderia steynii]SDH27092.1 MFS transporter, DHA2 family, methylenomycin A resistance protein [Paraburkholderia steynii]